MPLARGGPCRCAACKRLDTEQDEEGPPITAGQRAYADAFVLWMRSSDLEREQLDEVLAALLPLAKRP